MPEALEAWDDKNYFDGKRKRKRGKSKKYVYVMHVTETVENQVTITSRKKLNYDELERRAEQARVEGELDFVGISNVAFAVDDAKPF